MPPKKKKSGDASKGEKIFKNLCSACHSLAVSIFNTTSTISEVLSHCLFCFDCSLTRSDLLSEVSVVSPLLPVMVTHTHPLSPPKLPSSGPMVTSTSGWRTLLNLHLVTLWLLPELEQIRTAATWSLISRVD